ncbi:hypothetical protein EJB05_38301, partial [Eragrostis curvula]
MFPQLIPWFDFTVPNLYPHVQPQVYPPPPNPQGQGYQQYQGYLGEENPSYSSYGWSQHPPPAHSQQGPFQHYQEDPDCITFLRGCFAGLCCCCLLEQCCL